MNARQIAASELRCPVCGEASSRTREQLADEIAKLIKLGLIVAHRAEANDNKRLREAHRIKGEDTLS